MATRLLEPIIIKNMHLNNRLVMPPMATGKALPGGHVSPEMLAYYKEKSAGGYIGLVIIEHGHVSLEGKASERQLSVADDSAINGLRELAGIIHGQGSKAVMQINHAGSATSKDIIGTVPVAPSVVCNPVKNSVPRELTKEEIGGIVRAFAAAAGRVKEAGFDGVEIHSIYCYLLNQFFSPITNKRNDEYGGDVKNRVRIHLEIVRVVRETVGQDYPVFLRLSATDGCEGGTTIEDCKVAAKALEAAGIDVLDVSGGFCGFSIPGTSREPALAGAGNFAPLTEALKQVVSIPVILTGGIKDAKIADQLLQEGKADLIGVGRAIMSDSLWAKRAVESLRGR
jgi:2,4-dienoyl-CoA reductase-like NADH-dependent reductase (Old Yellow Enzyme family)